MTLAYFNVGSDDASGFYATIQWSGGGTDQVNLTPATNGLFAVTDTCTFENIGLQTASVTVYDEYGNASPTVTSTVEVGNLFAGVQGTLTLGTFSSDPGTVTINWGDTASDTSTATATPLSGGGYTITANHTYNEDSIDQPAACI